jgi:hypothetical protein
MGTRSTTIGAISAAWLLVTGCGPFDSSDAAAEDLVDALVDRTWIAVDHPLPRVPVVAFERSDRSDRVEVDGDDTCNDSTGPVTFDGTTVRSSEVFTTAAEQCIPGVTFISPGATFHVVGDELVISNPVDTLEPATRYVAWDALEEVTAGEVTGEYLAGTELFELRGAWPDEAWGEVRRTTGGDIVARTGDGFVRFDRIEAGEPARPTLAAFLGEVAGRTWTLDDPEYPSAERPFIRFALHQAAGTVPAAHGFDGCTRVQVTEGVHADGVWSPHGNGWALASPGASPSTTATNPCPAALHVPLTDAAYSIAADGRLDVIFGDGRVRTFADAASRPADEPMGPVAALDGTWILDTGGPTVEITADAAELTFGDCRARAISRDQYVELEATPCAPEGASPSAARLADWITQGANLTVGVTDDHATLYLTRDLSIDTPESAVLRLTRSN